MPSSLLTPAVKRTHVLVRSLAEPKKHGGGSSSAEGRRWREGAGSAWTSSHRSVARQNRCARLRVTRLDENDGVRRDAGKGVPQPLRLDIARVMSTVCPETYPRVTVNCHFGLILAANHARRAAPEVWSQFMISCLSAT
ncbi:hypothetical protein BV20DRAFT_110561 [Pilatotrama ljubarskyi]|nr:hypothetical protein BV20DRAFT_110561 [Pilatotrama ljubarskyi]